MPSDDKMAWLYENCGGHPYLTHLLLAKLLEQMQQDILNSASTQDLGERSPGRSGKRPSQGTSAELVRVLPR